MQSLVRFCLSVSIVLFAISCTNEAPFLENYNASSIPAALTLHACNSLAMRDFDSDSQKGHSEYAKAIQSGDIIMLKNDTSVEQDGAGLDFENGYLTTHKETGPISEREEN